jgi:hypothetical protein
MKVLTNGGELISDMSEFIQLQMEVADVLEGMVEEMKK